MAETMTVEAFRNAAPKKLDWLARKGFRRAEELENTSSTSATLVYRGKHVAFEFSLDVRDQCIDARVVRVREGKLLHNWNGGYSADVYRHLVKKEGYRGSPAGKLAKSSGKSKLDQAIDGWISLLDTAGSRLLSDRADSLD